MPAALSANELRRTICGIEELAGFHADGVTHVLSLVDPDLPEIEAFSRFAHHHRIILRFHDILAPRPSFIMPAPEHVEAILRYGERHMKAREVLRGIEASEHLLVHCHMGVSRSTAAMLALMAQANPDGDEDMLFAELRRIRPQAWPNSLMIAFADSLLTRGGRLSAALCRHYGVQLTLRPQFRTWMTELNRQVELDMAIDR